MLRVTLELVPRGNEAKKEPRGTIEIFNDGTGTPWLGSYGFRRFSSDGRLLKTGSIGEFKRSDFGPWFLAHAVLGALGFGNSKAWRDGAPRSKIHGAGRDAGAQTPDPTPARAPTATPTHPSGRPAPQTTQRN